MEDRPGHQRERHPAGLIAGGPKAAVAAIAMAASLLITAPAALPGRSEESARARSLPDLSGLAWVEDDLFLAVHDAKPSARKPESPRISLVRLPRSKREGVSWEPLPLTVPGAGGPISDLESVSRLPGGQGFLLAESGQGGRKARRLFLATVRNGSLELKASVPWPVPVTNVEATEVVQVGGQLLFLYAERADGRGETLLRWAPLSLNPLQFGAFREVVYRGVDPVGADGQPQVDLSAPARLATLDGLKVESLAVRESRQRGSQLFIGTDDENYGGILRPLPVPLTPARPRAAR